HRPGKRLHMSGRWIFQSVSSGCSVVLIASVTGRWLAFLQCFSDCYPSRQALLSAASLCQCISGAYSGIENKPCYQYGVIEPRRSHIDFLIVVTCSGCLVGPPVLSAGPTRQISNRWCGLPAPV